MEFKSNLSLASLKPIFLGNNSEQIYFIEETVLINQNFPTTCFNMVIFFISGVAVLMVNLAVLMWVKVKDRVLVDKMVAIDCIANIMMVGLLLLAFPVRIWNNRYLCVGITFYRVFTVTLNRSVYYY